MRPSKVNPHQHHRRPTKKHNRPDKQPDKQPDKDPDPDDGGGVVLPPID
jgi:hypothetical protein